MINAPAGARQRAHIRRRPEPATPASLVPIWRLLLSLSVNLRSHFRLASLRARVHDATCALSATRAQHKSGHKLDVTETSSSREFSIWRLSVSSAALVRLRRGGARGARMQISRRDDCARKYRGRKVSTFACSSLCSRWQRRGEHANEAANCLQTRRLININSVACRAVPSLTPTTSARIQFAHCKRRARPALHLETFGLLCSAATSELYAKRNLAALCAPPEADNKFS